VDRSAHSDDVKPRRPGWAVGDVALGLPLAVLLGMTLLATLPGWMTGQNPARQSLLDRHKPPGHVDDAGRTHALGTDHLGRDVWARLVHGARASLTVGYAGLALGAGFGVTLGLLGGFRGGALDRGLVGVIDAYLSFPYILIAIVWAALIRMTILTLVLIIALRGWVEFARVVRAQVVAIREREFVVAARALGATDMRLIARHVLPSTAGTILIIAGFQLGRLILLESTLSFLGLGIQPPTPAWGAMLADARLYLTQAWWTVAFPSLAISMVVLAANFLGDSLRDHLDPTIRGRL
jgi:peptide/nickel transport system permease protein